MIRMTHDNWWELTERIFDDAAGEIDDPGIQVEIIDENWIGLHFSSPQDQTFFCLRWIQ